MEVAAVKKRSVVFICGYEIAPPDVHHRRFGRELPVFEAAWNVKSELSPCSVDQDRHIGQWRLVTTGPNWRVETDYRLYWWGDLITYDFAMPDWRRLTLGFVAFFDFLFSKTILAYFRTNWRYALFFLYPYVFLMLVGAGGFYLTWRLIGWLLPWPGLWAALVGIGCVFGILKLPARPLYVGYLLGDWSFARDLVRHLRPALDARLDQFARALVGHVRDSTADEIVLVGHSLGAVQVVDVVARAKRLDPQFGAGRVPVAILTIGSSLLKIGLHPAATELKQAVREVANDPHIFWVEYQALIDIINFYKSNPVTDLGLPPCDKPVVKIARIRHMLKEATYKGLRRDFFRVHRQFVMANEQRYFYDYYMICCGPVPLPQRVAFPEGAVAAFAPDGAFDPDAVTKPPPRSGKAAAGKKGGKR
jgi:hypothetical protein